MLTSADISRSLARTNLLDFVSRCWYSSSPFIVGIHTREICARIDSAIARYVAGESTRLVISVPFRHGKSDLSSRYLPAQFLGRFPAAEIMCISYAESLSASFSKDTRDRIVRSEEYQKIFRTRIDRTTSAITNWQTVQGGKTFYSGLDGSLTGKGYALGVVDDAFKNRDESESLTIRDKRWESFTNDFMTRAAPVSITLLVMTRWHDDDIVGRIEQRMDKDPEFPKFEMINYPARSETYQSGYLFPERFSERYYREQFATLGDYAASALLQGQPKPRSGNMFRVENMKRAPRATFPNLRYAWAWDLASSEKQRAKDDPDWSVGVLSAVERITVGDIVLDRLWVKDIIRVRQTAPKRNRTILSSALSVGPEVPNAIESIGGYKDAAATLADILHGRRTVVPITTSTDKVVRCSALEPLFEAGNIIFADEISPETMTAARDELTSFPRGRHDDITDAIATGYNFLRRDSGVSAAQIFNGVATEDRTGKNW